MSTPILGAAVFLGNAPAPEKVRFNYKPETGPTWKQCVEALATYAKSLEDRIATLEAAAMERENERIN